MYGLSDSGVTNSTRRPNSASKKKSQLHERVKRLGPGLELHQHIDITLTPLLLADKGAK